MNCRLLVRVAHQPLPRVGQYLVFVWVGLLAWWLFFSLPDRGLLTPINVSRKCG